MNGGGNLFFTLCTAGGILLVMMIMTGFYATRYRKIGPNQALVISGRRQYVPDPQTKQQQTTGFRIVVGGGTFVWPIVERVDTLSLESISFDFTITGQFRDGHEARIQGEAQVAVGQDKAALHQAASRLLSKTPKEIAELARQMLAPELRSYIRQTSAAEMRASCDQATEQITHAWRSSLANLGLVCLNLNIVHID